MRPTGIRRRLVQALHDRIVIAGLLRKRGRRLRDKLQLGEVLVVAVVVVVFFVRLVDIIALAGLSSGVDLRGARVWSASGRTGCRNDCGLTSAACVWSSAGTDPG